MVGWDKIRLAREYFKSKAMVSDMPIGMRLILSEMRELKNRIKELEKKIK